MKEILFRGKRLDNNEWVYGFYVCGSINSSLHEIFTPDDSGGLCARYIVDPSTVGQYTGLTDKNGVKIFEGDVLRNVEYGEIGYVCEWHGCPTFAVKTDDGVLHYTTLFIEMPDDDMEVIGNIFDNSELIPVYKAEGYQDY